MKNSTIIWIIAVLAILAAVVIYLNGAGFVTAPAIGTLEPATTTTGTILNQLGSTTPTSSPRPETRVFDVKAANFSFTPNQIVVNSGDMVELSINSDGPHDFVIDEFGIKQPTPAGVTVIRFTPEKKGTYIFYCSVDSHRERGMTGRFIVK